MYVIYDQMTMTLEQIINIPCINAIKSALADPLVLLLEVEFPLSYFTDFVELSHGQWFTPLSLATRIGNKQPSAVLFFWHHPNSTQLLHPNPNQIACSKCAANWQAQTTLTGVLLQYTIRPVRKDSNAHIDWLEINIFTIKSQSSGLSHVLFNWVVQGSSSATHQMKLYSGAIYSGKS